VPFIDSLVTNRHDRRGICGQRGGNVRVIVCLAAIACLVFAPTANADPVQHFGTFVIECDGEQFEIVSKPGSSNFVDSTSVSILMGVTVIDTATGEVLDEFHKPYTEHQDVTICQDITAIEDGLTVIVEALNTPPG
jgi:hypothetical protein